jgi:hypothetical protein
MKYVRREGRVHILMNVPVQYERNRFIIPDSGIEDEALPTNQNKAILTVASCFCCMMVKRPFTESHSLSLWSIHLADANRLEEAFSSFAKAASRRSRGFSIVSESISSHPTIFEGLCFA